jgi:aminopeptidase N
MKKLTYDSSYSVAGAALEALATMDSASAIDRAHQMMKETSKGRLTGGIATVLTSFNDPQAFDFVAGKYERMPLTQEKFELTSTLAEVVGEVTDPIKFKKGIDLIVEMRNSIPASQRPQTDPYINNFFLKKIGDKKKAGGQMELADYVKQQIEKK